MERESRYSLMSQIMMGNGVKVSKKVKVSLNGQTAKHGMMVSFTKTNSMVKENLNGRTTEYTMVNGKTDY
jgi:hypothetical protein